MKLKLRIISAITVLAFSCILCSCSSADQQEEKAEKIAVNTENIVTCAPEDTAVVTEGVKKEETNASVTEAADKAEEIKLSDAWKKVKEFKPSEKNIQARYTGFFNEKFGIATYQYGILRFTQDGGETWTVGKNKSDCIAGLEIIDETNAVITANYSEVRVSKDSGANWEEVPNFGDMKNEHCRYASFINQKTGWIANRKEIGYTSDGGATWTSVNTPANLSDISAIWLSSSAEGYILSSDGKLYTTTDSGKTWAEKELGLSGFMILVCPTAALHVEDSQTFQIVAYLENGADKGYFYLSTTDGGTTWTRKEMLAEGGPGFVYLQRDGSLLTLSEQKEKTIRVYQYVK